MLVNQTGVCSQNDGIPLARESCLVPIVSILEPPLATGSDPAVDRRLQALTQQAPPRESASAILPDEASRASSTLGARTVLVRTLGFALPLCA